MDEQPSDLHALPALQQRLIFGGVLGAVFMSAMDATIVATALPEIVSKLGGFEHYTFVATAYFIGCIMAIPITGKLIDTYGRKWFYIGGIVIFTGGSLLSGLSGTMTELIWFRGLQGIGAGLMIANGFTILGDLYSPAERGKYQSYISVIFGLSSIIGPLAGGALTDYLGWRWIFFINLPLGIAIILLFVRFLPMVQPLRQQRKIDYPGILLIVLSIVPLLLALSWGGVKYPWLSPQIIGMIAFAAAMGLVLHVVERRNPAAIIPVPLYKNPIILISVGATFLLGFAMYSGIIFLPLWFQGVQEASATASGSYLTPMMVGLVVGAVASGQALSRLGGHYRLQGIIGMLIFAAGLWLLASLQVNTSYGTAIWYMVTTGFGLGITFPLYSTAIQNVASLQNMGAAISVVPCWRFMGAALGLAVLGSILVNSFATDLIAGLPSSLKQAIPAAAIYALAHNPHGLVTGHGQAAMKELLGRFGLVAPTHAYQLAVHALHQALDFAITRVMFTAFITVLLALVMHIFIQEIPLRRQHAPLSTDMTPTGICTMISRQKRK